MAERKIDSLLVRKARLCSESELLRYQFDVWGRSLQRPASAIETGFEFALVTADLLQISRPWRQAKPGRKWLALPRVLSRFFRWRQAVD